jgi:hypothetical protein
MAEVIAEFHGVPADSQQLTHSHLASAARTRLSRAFGCAFLHGVKFRCQSLQRVVDIV